jgi:hypothetical protein
MDERAEYWWVRHGSEVKPARVAFVGGIPAQIQMIGSSDPIPAASVELIERLPNPPAPVFRQQDQQQAPPARPQRSGSLLWLVGVLLLILVAQCSGSLFDAIG